MHLGEVREQEDEIRRLGAQVLAVSFARPDQVAAYRARQDLPWPVVADPSQAAYRTFELGRTSWWTILQPRLLARYVNLFFRGRPPHQPYTGEGVLLLGGDFVLDRRRRLVYAYRSSDPTDRPAPEELLRALRAAAKRG